MMDILQEAVRHHQAGRLREAEPLYRRVLARSPEQFDALHLLGVVLSQTRRYEEAERLLRRALNKQPNLPSVLSNLGNLLRESGRVDEAIPHLRRAVQAGPNMPEAHHNLGVALQLLKQSTEAEACFRKSIALRPDYPEPHNSLGNIFRAAGKFDEAVALFRRALSLRPDYPEALTSLGAALQLQHKNEEAFQSCRRAIELRPDYAEAYNNFSLVLHARKQEIEGEAACRTAIRLKPDYAEAYSNLGVMLTAQQRFDEAILTYRQALKIKADLPDAWMNLGAALRNLKRFEEAKEACRRAIELNPRSADALTNLGVVYLDLCQLDEAIAAYRRAVAKVPDSALAHWGLALALLVHGDYEEGWREYEWRWQCRGLFATRPNYPQPTWDGADPRGKTLFLYSEQGYGDAIQFVRYAPLVAQRGARVIVQCQPALQSLFATLPGVAEVRSVNDPLPAFDAHASLLSLPMLFGTTLQSVPAVPYLSATPERKEAWRQKLGACGTKLKVGLVWAGNPEHQRDRDRSCDLSALSPLWRISDVCLVSLQKAAPKVSSPPPAGSDLLDLTADLTDFAETAALIENLDLVIAVDTSVAHLAGAMGKPVWTLLAFAPDWRWLLHRPDTPWYPSMRLFRQPAVGDWESVIAEVAAQLSRLAAAKAQEQQPHAVPPP